MLNSLAGAIIGILIGVVAAHLLGKSSFKVDQTTIVAASAIVGAIAGAADAIVRATRNR